MSRFEIADLRTLGATGIRVSPIGLGTVKFGRNTGVKYPGDFALPNDVTLAKLLAVAGDCGINLIDTAPAYGTSENRLGSLLSGIRDNWVLCTKTGERFEGGRSSFDFSAAGTRDSVEASLRNLRTGYLDIVLVHCSDTDVTDLQESDALETLQKLKDSGDIRAFGASTKTVEGGLAALALCDLVMVAYNMDDTSQLQVLDEAGSSGKGLLVKKALESGHARQPAEALRFATRHPAVSSAIVGTIDEGHLIANVEAIAGRRSSELTDLLD